MLEVVAALLCTFSYIFIYFQIYTNPVKVVSRPQARLSCLLPPKHSGTWRRSLSPPHASMSALYLHHPSPSMYLLVGGQQAIKLYQTKLHWNSVDRQKQMQLVFARVLGKSLTRFHPVVNLNLLPKSQQPCHLWKKENALQPGPAAGHKCRRRLDDRC